MVIGITEIGSLSFPHTACLPMSLCLTADGSLFYHQISAGPKTPCAPSTARPHAPATERRLQCRRVARGLCTVTHRPTPLRSATVCQRRATAARSDASTLRCMCLLGGARSIRLCLLEPPGTQEPHLSLFPSSTFSSSPIRAKAAALACREIAKFLMLNSSLGSLYCPFLPVAAFEVKKHAPSYSLSRTRRWQTTS